MEDIVSKVNITIDSFNNSVSNIDVAGQFGRVCELNQLEMLSAVQGYPLKSFWLVATTVLCLAIYMAVMPRFKETIWTSFISSRILWVAFAAGLTGLFLMFYTTFTITPELNSSIEIGMITFAALLLLVALWDNREKLRGLVKKQ
jgi:drug/metabolite transporter (DMT)-like permease